MNQIRMILIIMLSVAGLLGWEMTVVPKTASANGAIFGAWGGIYPDSSSNDISCQMCHQNAGGGDGWNPYGWSMRQQINDEGLDIMGAIRAIEALDADGNGQTNLAEISGSSQPGWTTGAANTIFFKDGTTQTDQEPPSSAELLDLTDTDTGTDEENLGLADPIPDGILQTDTLSIQLTASADGLLSPLTGTATPSLPDYLFVADQTGEVWQINLSDGTQSIYLDMSSQIIALGAFGNYDERGLLGFAMHPDYATNGFVYTHSSEPVAGSADFSTMPEDVVANHHTVIAQWQVDDPSSPTSVVNMETKKVLLRIDQPQFNHNGGVIAFGPDDMLYIGMGDGGGADDQNFGGGTEGHGEDGNGQDLTNPLGTILRIDPLGDNSDNGQYGIPADNPFVNSDDALAEIFAYGLRNPYSISFDNVDGTLYAGDVGQNDVEEINIIEAGGNYGWPLKEGSFIFDQNDGNDGFVTDQEPANLPDDLIDPIAEYDHDEGLSAIGGFVYRGATIPELQGRYVFGDWGLSFENPPGRLFYLTEGNAIAEFNVEGTNSLDTFVTGFAQDASGELYALGNTSGTPFPDDAGQNTGVVMRILPSSPTELQPDQEPEYQVYLPVISR